MHPHSASFDLRRELKLLRCPPHIVERLCRYGYDDRGSFAALSEDVLRSAPLYVDRKTRRKIVALAEIYRQQDLRDEAAPTNYLAKRSIEERQDAKAFQTGDEEFFGADSASFPSFSELQGRVDGVCATPRPRDAVDAVVRESTHLVEFRDGVRAAQARRAR